MIRRVPYPYLGRRAGMRLASWQSLKLKCLPNTAWTSHRTLVDAVAERVLIVPIRDRRGLGIAWCP